MQVRLQSLVSGFTGKPVMVYAIYDTELEKCIIGKIGRSTAEKMSGAVLISDTETAYVDDKYEDTDITPSINDYYALLKRGALIIKENVQESDPQSAIEFEGITNGKKDYRVMPSIRNSQVAVLAICRHIQKSKKAEQAIQFMDDFFDLTDGLVVSI